MGLDFSHGNASWSYTGFGRFRARLAEIEGFDLDKMQGFHGNRSWDTVTTPLKPLLNHSDCDGELTPAECAEVYPRLMEIVSDWSDHLPEGWEKKRALDLAEAMIECAATGENLEFC